MRHSLKTGFSFGFTSAIITTLGLMIGLHSGTGSKLAVLGGILTIAIADAFSDAVGVHISEESENIHTLREIWEATLMTFFAKLIFALTFTVAIFLLPFNIAIIVNIVYGLILLCIFSFYLSKKEKNNSWRIIGEHLLIAIVVIIITHYFGDLIHRFFV